MYVTAKDISFGYTKGKQVLHKISFSIGKGETLGIVGASGCGKSTLLRIISSLLPNNSAQSFSGTLKIDGSETKAYLDSGQLSLMFQEPALAPHLSVFQNIKLPLKIKSIEDDKKVSHLIEMIGLAGYENYLPKKLSGGMKTRVSMARAFITNPSLLLLDEPFSSLDIAWRNTLYTELSALKTKFETTIILVSHDISEAITLCNKILCIGSKGRVIEEIADVDQPGLQAYLESAIIADSQLNK